MNIRLVRLRTHQRNIGRYEGMLETKLTDAEKRFVEKRLSEERLAIAMLQFMGPSPSASKDRNLPETPE